MYTLLSNGLIVTQNEKREIISNGAILISNSKIIDVDNAERLKEKTQCLSDEVKVFDLNGNIVIPGLINTHVHLEGTKYRGYFEFSNLQEYLSFSAKIDKKLLKESEVIKSSSVSLSIAELIASGTTTICGGRYWGKKEISGKLVCTYPLYKGHPSLNFYYDNFPMLFEEICTERCDKTNLPRLIIFVHSLLSIETSVLSTVKDMLEKFQDVLFTIHISETLEEKEKIRERFGCTATQLLNDYGLLSERTLLVHCTFVSDRDLDLIADANANIIYCPSSNLRIGQRLPNLVRMLEKGINVCLGTDGVDTSGCLSLLDEARTACLIYNFLNRGAISTQKALDMITLAPAKALNSLESIGSIEPNKEADLVIFDYNAAALHPVENIMHNLIYASPLQKLIDSVMIGGKCVYSRNNLPSSLEQIINDFEITSRRIKKTIENSI